MRFKPKSAVELWTGPSGKKELRTPWIVRWKIYSCGLVGTCRSSLEYQSKTVTLLHFFIHQASPRTHIRLIWVFFMYFRHFIQNIQIYLVINSYYPSSYTKLHPGAEGLSFVPVTSSLILTASGFRLFPLVQMCCTSGMEQIHYKQQKSWW